MESWDWLRQDWSYLFKLVATLLLLILYVAVVSVTNIYLGRYAKKHHLAYRRLIYTRKFVNILLFLLFFPLVLGFWGINLRGLLVLASSLFALVGIAFFASWSLLSNITSSLILFVAFPLRIGDTIRILDGDNSVEGEILDMGLFNIKIRTSQGGIVLYPNNLFLQKPVVKILKDSPEEVFYPW